MTDEAGRRWHVRLFAPILAGATLRERLIACLGALVAISLTGWVSALFVPGGNLPLIVAPIGASAVLLFAVPTSPLAQPWPIIGGNTISALVGVIVTQLVPDPVFAIGISVAMAIAIMSFTRSLHPPGGAAALSAVLGGHGLGLLYPLVPVALNSVILVALGLCFHRLTRRTYPHVPARVPANPHHTRDPAPDHRVGFQPQDVDAALTVLDETFDIDRADLDRLLRQVEIEALTRSGKLPSCADIMSRDVVSVSVDDSLETARALLIDHNIRTLPVIDREGLLAGTVGLRDLLGSARRVAEVMSLPKTAQPADPAARLLPVLTDGRSHAVVIVDPEGRVLGLITQTDMLATITKWNFEAAPA